MSHEHPTALVAGATGLVGRCVLEDLTSRVGTDGAPAYGRVTVLTRRPLADVLGPGTLRSGSGVQLREVVADFAQLDRVKEALHADHVFCALGTTLRKAGSREGFREVDFEYPRMLAHLGREAGARHFSLVSSTGADPLSRNFYLRVKGETEEVVADAGYPSVSLLRPSVIGGARDETRPLETLGKWALSLVPGRLRTVQARDIARCMVTLALEETPGVRVVESEEIRRIAGAGR